MKDSILEIINEIRQSSERSILENINESDRLREDLGLTSFDLAELTVKLEDLYDIDVFESGLVETIGEIMSKLNK